MSTYFQDSEGKFIPSTQRPDGTWRKARRVKQGYVPQEEVPLYESKGKQFAQRKSDVIPGMCPFVAEAAKKDREAQERGKVKKAEKEAAKQKQQNPGVIVLPQAKATNPSQSTKSSSTSSTSNAISNATIESLANNVTATLHLHNDPLDHTKKLKRLRKKLREIETIEEKMKNKEFKPDKDQLEKIKRKLEILKEIKQIEELEAALRTE